MKILVLGATGFIGRNMAERFVGLGHHVTATHHLRPTYEGAHWIRADLREPFDFSGYDVVIQAAATTSGSKDIVNNPAIHVTDNAVMNALIFRAAVEAKVKHVIFFSCTTMFSEGHVTEESPIDIHPRYFGVAHTKLYNEKMAEFYAGVSGTKFTVIRHSNCYGPYDKYDAEKSHFFGATIAKIEQAKDNIVVWGDGQEARDLLHVNDLVRFVGLAITNQKDKFRLFNCGSGVAYKVKDLVEKIIAASGKEISIIYDDSKPSIPVSLSLDCAKAEKELGWKPEISLEEGIGLTLDWYRKNIL